MAGVKDYSTTAANNNASPPNGAPEGMAPNTVNDTIRQIMADTRGFYEGLEWRDWGFAPTYVTGTSFTLAGDRTSIAKVGRRVRLTGTTPFTLYGTIATSVFSTNTTVTVTLDSGTLDSSLNGIAFGIDNANSTLLTVPGSSSITTNMIQNDAVTYAKMQNVSVESRILGRKTTGAGDTEELTLSDLLDFVGSAAQGDILYRGASGWARLGAGTSGFLLKTNGTGANPSWTALSSGGLSKGWANFNGTSAANVSGTYSQTGTTITITVTAHGHLVGHRVFASFTTGTATSASYTVVSVVDANNFTVTSGTSTSTSGNVTLNRRTIRASFGVHSVTYNATGDYSINLTTANADVNGTIFAIASNVNTGAATAQLSYAGYMETVSSARLSVFNSNSAAFLDMAFVSTTLFGN